MLDAVIYAGLADKDKAFDCLNEALRDRTLMLEIGYLVEFDPLRSDHRFDQLMHSVGLR